MLIQFLWLELYFTDIIEIWFQQISPTCYNIGATIILLKRKFDDAELIISYSGHAIQHLCLFFVPIAGP